MSLKTTLQEKSLLFLLEKAYKIVTGQKIPDPLQERMERGVEATTTFLEEHPDILYAGAAVLLAYVKEEFLKGKAFPLAEQAVAYCQERSCLLQEDGKRLELNKADFVALENIYTACRGKPLASLKEQQLLEEKVLQGFQNRQPNTWYLTLNAIRKEAQPFLSGQAAELTERLEKYCEKYGW